MKKFLSALLAAAAVVMASAALAADPLVLHAPVSADDVYNFSLAGEPNRADIEVFSEDTILYTFAEPEKNSKTFSLHTAPDTAVSVRAVRGKADVQLVRTETDTYSMTIRSAAGVRDFAPEKFSAELAAGDKTYYIRGRAAYSESRRILPGETLAIRPEEGSIIEWEGNFAEPAEIVCSDRVTLTLSGRYGSEKENLSLSAALPEELREYFGDSVEYYDFIAAPRFGGKVQLHIKADSYSYIYEYNERTGDVTQMNAEYIDDGWTFSVKECGKYLISGEEFGDCNVRQ